MCNPHQAQASRYLIPHPQNGLTDLAGRPAGQAAQDVHDLFVDFVTATPFPCFLGKSAVNQARYRFALYQSIRDPASLDGLAHDLWEYATERHHIRGGMPGRFATFIASFLHPDFTLPESWFEGMLWDVLQELNNRDQSPWDPAKSKDPADPNFSFSFAGTSFFVVGMHGGASRNARRFDYPTLVFNLSEQFETLRNTPSRKAANAFAHAQNVIRASDVRLQKSINPNLDLEEAKQYSGRAITGPWSPPGGFTAK